MHKLAVSAALLALAEPMPSNKELKEWRQLREAQERRNQEIELICSDVVASMGFSDMGKQEDNSAVNCELIFDDGSSTSNGSNRLETMMMAADYQCVYPEVDKYKSKQPTPKNPQCWVGGYPIDFSPDNALLSSSSDCSDFAEPPANSVMTFRHCDRVFAAIADVREDVSYEGVVCSCVHADAVVTDERKDEVDFSK